MQARRLAESNGDLRLGPAELRQARAQAIDVETGMHSDVEQACDALRPELSGCVSEATKRLTYRRQVGFPSRGQDHLPCQPLEQLHTQPLLQQTNLLTYGASSDVQLVRGLLKAEMAGGRLEGAQSIEGRQ